MNESILKYLMSEPSMAFWIKELDSDIASKVVCAFANTNGGCVVVGIGDDMNVAGVNVDQIDSFVKLINDSITPLAPFCVTNAEHGGKQVLLINVWEGNSKPYSTHNAFYVLTGNIVRRANIEEISVISEEANITSSGWERQIVPGLDLDELSENTLKRFKKAFVDNNRLTIDAENISVVRQLGFYPNRGVSNAGAVMLCKNPTVYFPQTRIRVSVFGIDDRLLDVRLFDQNLLEAVDKIVDYVTNLYPKHIVINGLERIEEESLPVVALREGLLNAVVHRVYDRYDSFVAINIFDNYLEIVNSGSLPENMTEKDLLGTHRSILRNPDIANAFYTIKYIEMAGTGIFRIVEECKKNRCEIPIWKVENNMVTLRFNVVRQNLANGQKEWAIDINKFTSDTTVKNSLIVIIDFMKTHEKVKLADIATLIDKSYPTVKRYMRILTDSGLVVYEGNNRSGGWYLAKNRM